MFYLIFDGRVVDKSARIFPVATTMAWLEDADDSIRAYEAGVINGVIVKDVSDAEFEAQAPVREALARQQAFNNNPELPSVSDKIDALFQFVKTSDKTQVEEIDAKIVRLKLKHGVT